MDTNIIDKDDIHNSNDEVVLIDVEMGIKNIAHAERINEDFVSTDLSWFENLFSRSNLVGLFWLIISFLILVVMWLL
ncbi:MAG: hypothetical protein ACRC4M_04775 [Mycoplasma sp.]